MCFIVYIERLSPSNSTDTYLEQIYSYPPDHQVTKISGNDVRHVLKLLFRLICCSAVSRQGTRQFTEYNAQFTVDSRHIGHCFSVFFGQKTNSKDKEDIEAVKLKNCIL